MGDKAPRAKLAFSIVILGEVGTLSQHVFLPLPGLRSTAPGLGRTRFHFQKARQSSAPSTAHPADLRHRETRGEVSCPGSTDWQGHMGMQTPTLALAPLQRP